MRRKAWSVKPELRKMPATRTHAGAQPQRGERRTLTYSRICSGQPADWSAGCCGEGWVQPAWALACSLLWKFLGRVQSWSRLGLPGAQGHSWGGDPSPCSGKGDWRTRPTVVLPSVCCPFPNQPLLGLASGYLLSETTLVGCTLPSSFC